ncbi:MAG: class A beta-lactamase [Pseudomonadota bacterium]
MLDHRQTADQAAYRATPHRPNRRSTLLGLATLGLLPACNDGQRLDETVPEAALTDPIIDIEDATGGRIGVAAINLTTGERFTHRSGERHAMCSAFKWLLAALVLRRVEREQESLTRLVRYTAEDIVSYSPVTQPRIDTGMTVSDLCAAAVSTSDNTATNLLLATLGGPEGFTAQIRELGDTTTRLDRWEPALNENAEGDPRDTTTPDAMLDLMARLLFADALTPPSQETLRGWMIEASTGLQRLRAGLPTDWIAGDKTGTSTNDQSNDVAFAIDPTGATGPLLIVSFLNVPEPMSDERNFAHAAIARELVNRLV